MHPLTPAAVATLAAREVHNRIWTAKPDTPSTPTQPLAVLAAREVHNRIWTAKPDTPLTPAAVATLAAREVHNRN